MTRVRRSGFYFQIIIYLVLGGVVGVAIEELEAFKRPAAFVAALAAVGAAALFIILRNNWLARAHQAELRFEEEPPDKLLSLDLS